MPRFAPEGYPFIIISALLTVAVFVFFGVTVALIPFIVMLFMFFFFRDPERTIPDAHNLIVAPADGKVIKIDKTHEPRFLKAMTKGVSIFMSPLDVHVNRSPCDGRVSKIRHNKGRFVAAYRDDASLKNENIEMVLNTQYGDILVRQVAGSVARRAVCRKKEGDSVRRGERYGIIKFSSRLDVYLPLNVDIKVKLNDKVKAGETIIAEVSST
jgi:phosphatidylserine decarboxylase